LQPGGFGAEHATEEAWNYPLILWVFDLRERVVDYEALFASQNRHTACSENFDPIVSQRRLSDLTARANSA
jgi:hypothetical protein